VTPRSPGDFDRKLIAPMILGSILNPVNSSMIAVALIPIGVAFGASPSATAWLVSALYLATATGQPVVGRLVDMYGPRRLFLAGATLVGIAGVLGALAPSLGGLIVARVLLGFGTCAGYPAAMYLIRSEARRTGHDSPGSVLTALAVAGQTVAVLGPPLGGLLIGVGGWRTIFAVNIPLALASLVLGALRLPRSSGSGGSLRGVDLPGIALFAATLTTLLLFLMDLRLDRWWLLVSTAVAAAGFVVRELRVAEPFIDLRVFGGNIPLLTTYVRTLLAYTVSYAFLYGYTQWLEAGRGLSTSQAGLILLPVFLSGIVVASLTGRRTEVRAKLVVGGICQIVACGLLLVLHPASAIAVLVAVAVILGIPQGLISLANQNAVYYQADPTRMGASAGLLRTFMYLGAIVASAATGAFFKHGADTSGLHGLATFMLVVGVLFLALTFVDRSLGRVGSAPPSSGEDNPVALTTLDPTTALVVIDLQQGIVAAPVVPHAGADVVSRAVELATAFRAHGAPVVLVRVTAAPDGSDTAPGRTEAGSRGVRPEGWDTIVEDLATDPNDIIVTKRNWGAFFGTDLDLQLRRRGVTQIVLAGVATSIGVESTARAAHEHGYHVTLATDAMADLDVDAHRHSIEKIFPRLGETGTTAEIIDLLEKTHA
jgi:nicotinamidase-related amidase/predicted MFS family arabinose efflux permease